MAKKSLSPTPNFQIIFHSFPQFSETGNQSLSVLTFIPVVDDDGKYLTCRSENPFIPDSAIEDKWRLVVHCKSLQTFPFVLLCFVHKITEIFKHKKVASIFLMTFHNEAIQSIKRFSAEKQRA